MNPFGPVNFLIHYIENVNRVGKGERRGERGKKKRREGGKKSELHFGFRGEAA